MKSVLLILMLHLCVFVCQSLNAQSLSGSLGVGYVYIPQDPEHLEDGLLLTASAENFFNAFFSVGFNAKFAGVSYKDDYTEFDNNKPKQETELDISNFVYSISFFPRFSFLRSDELILSIVPEVGLYHLLSEPTIYFTDYSNDEVTSKNYSSEKTRSIAWGVSVQGEYFLKERLSLLICIGWNNYDLSTTINTIDIKGDFPGSVHIVETDFLYAEIGLSYLISGNDKRF